MLLEFPPRILERLAATAGFDAFRRLPRSKADAKLHDPEPFDRFGCRHLANDGASVRKRRHDPFGLHAPDALPDGASADAKLLHELRFNESLTRHIFAVVEPADYRPHDPGGCALQNG